MGKERLAAFSDGVLAIIVTIMVLELRVPHGANLAASDSPQKKWGVSVNWPHGARIYIGREEAVMILSYSSGMMVP